MMPSNSHARRHVIGGRDDWLCAYCVTPVRCWCGVGHRDGVAQATIDHVVPRSSGGSNDPMNLVVACLECNAKKGDGEWPVDVSLRRPKRRRPLTQRISRTGECRRKGTTRKVYATREIAEAMCTAVWNVHAVDLIASHCDKCGHWHIGARRERAKISA